MSEKSAAPDAATVVVMTRRPLRDPAGAEAILDVLERSKAWTPSHIGPDERARAPYDRAEVARILALRPADGDGYIGLRRSKAPRYEASFQTNNAGLKDVQITWPGGLQPAELPDVFALGDALATELAADLAFVGVAWVAGTKGKGAGSFSAKELQRFGLFTVYPRTWFGPELARRLGRDALARCGAVEDLPSGGVRLDLASPPWAVTAAGLERARKAALATLAPSGLFGDYSKPWRAVPGPRWTPLPT